MTILRGAVDSISSRQVSGWMYSDAASVRDATVLAMLDNQCVGAGRIEIFRPDLADAGLGDGYLGFEISIAVPKPGDEGRVVVKLDGSDGVLLQAASRVGRGDVVSGVTAPSFRTAKSLDWMRGRGWLDQMEIDVFRAIDQFGAYDRSLRLTKVAEKVSGTPVLDPQQEARQLFEVLQMQRVTVREQRVPSVAALAEQRIALAESTPEPVIALWSAQRSVVVIVEGSHQDGGPHDQGLAGGVEHFVGPDRLLLLDLRTRFGARDESQPAELRVFLVVADDRP